MKNYNHIQLTWPTLLCKIECIAADPEMELDCSSKATAKAMWVRLPPAVLF